jgi:hypothetical protein
MGLEVKDKEGFASTLKRSDPKAKRSSIKE